MRSTIFLQSHLRKAAVAVTLCLTAGAAFAAPTVTTVHLTAQRTSATLPDSNTVPMWGLCSTDAAGSAGLGGAVLVGGNCAAMTTNGWMPGPTITVPYDAVNGNSLVINLTNNLKTPTSLVILGQLGGGLGSPVKEASPLHNSAQVVSWPAVGNSTGPLFTPPAQEPRARAFSAEAAAGATQTYTWAKLKPGTYLYETGTHPSIQAPMGLYGVLVVTSAPVAGTPTVAGKAYTNVSYDADATLLFSEIDPKQNAAVDATPLVTGIIDERQYPPAVNYSPRYFLINGHSFDNTNPQASAFAAPSAAASVVGSGNVLIRFVNAGLRTHIPTVVGLSMSLVAEDSNVAPGKPKVQSEVLLTAGKTFDVVVKPPVSGTNYVASTYAIFDRQLSLSANNQPNGGMQGILQVAGGPLATAMQCAAGNDNYTVAVNSASFSSNVLSNDRGIVSTTLGTAPVNGTVQLNSNGTFTYTPTKAPVGADSFTYSGLCASSKLLYTATVNLSVTSLGAAPVAQPDAYTSKVASLLKVTRPGVLGNDSDPKGYKLTAALDTVAAGVSVILNTDGSFTAAPAVKPTASTNYVFTYHAVNAQGTSSAPVSVTLTFNKPSGVQVSVVDTQDKTIIPDYSWTIEEDTTFFHDPANPAGTGPLPTSLATSFHKSYMPLVATGCTGPRSCGDSNTVTVNGVKQPVTQRVRTSPSDVVLEPNKRYYISVLPGDAIDGAPDQTKFGHSMGGAPMTANLPAVTVLAPRNALPGGQISVIVFEDKSPTNGNVDNPANEPGLGGFTINLFDTRGSSGDPAGQMTYDLSGQPLTNSLVGTKTLNGVNLCPGSPPQGVIITCPELDSAGNVSPLAGMALIKNVNPGRYDVTATPGADREGRGETWVQVSTLEGTRNNDTFVKAGEPGYWQEFGSPGFHSYIGFVNPDHIRAVHAAQHGTNTVTGKISSLHMDRPPAAKLNDSCATTAAADPTCRASLAYTICQVSLNAQGGNGDNIAYTTCDQAGNFTLTGIPSGTHELVIWDQYLDQIIAKKIITVPAGNNQTVQAGTVPVFSWFTRVEQTAYMDLNKNGIRDAGEPGVSQIPMNVRFRDGSISNFARTDSSGVAGINELFPLFNWYVVESDTTRFKGTGVNVTYDAGGKPDTAGKYAGVLNSTETASLPPTMQIPTSTYTVGKTNRIDSGDTQFEGLQGFINQTAILDWGKTPYDPGENGGIAGLVFYASTRGFDDPRREVQFSWEPAIPRVQINLYAKSGNPDGTQSLALIDTTYTNSWDDTAASIHCPGNNLTDPFITWTLGAANQFKCYDGQHAFNQVQPAVYDGHYDLPSKTYAASHPKGLPTGKYVVEVVVPDGYEIVKEEDKNILIGDPWIAPSVKTQFGGLGNIFILPDQATLNDSVIPGSGVAFPTCVGDLHRVPDFLSLFPETGGFAPYAGHDRPLCDRKEVSLNEQMAAAADFQLFTHAPIAAHFTGLMLNDAAAEFDPVSPSFGEKAVLPNAPVSFRDYNGVEILRVYNDKWGTFNGLAPSTWEANVPNPSGYAPNMLTSCMNDPGPIPDPAGTLDPKTGKVRMIVDPLYNPMFSNFCYVWPYMPGITTYLDTPVLPTAAFASASSYSPVDCQYPDATPAISRVDGNGSGTDQSGKVVSGGPYVDLNALAPPKVLTITALGNVSVLNPAYTGPTALTAIANQPRITRHYGFGNVKGAVSLNGVNIPAANITTWADGQIVLTVPNTARTGELVITSANGKASVDTVTVTIENSGVLNYRRPKYLSPPDPSTSTATGPAHPIQDAIDAARPGDLILLDAGSYPELVIMWKPVRLQGVGAASVVINATKYPNGKVAEWRTRINALFGVDADGNVTRPIMVDPLPGQEITGGIIQLEPSVLASESGAGITVLAKGELTDVNGAVVRRLTRSSADCRYSASNFLCAASRIDGISVTGGDAGGGIYVNGWAHNLEIANTRVYGNAGPYHGGVRIGQPYLEGKALSDENDSLGYDNNVHIHHNAITTNGMVEGTPGAAGPNTGGAGGGLSMCSGSDNYRITSNWICGNFSSGDGGGIGHIGLSMRGTISKNSILFNESYNQTGLQHGGGLAIEGEQAAGTVLSLGTGDVTVDSNLIQGNFARAGNGGGIRLQNVNGADARDERWRVRLTNNMIVNNLAGMAGGGISMADTLFSVLINNTVAANDSTGIVGSLFNTQVGAANTGATTGVPSPAGISSELTSPLLLAFLPANQQAANRISNPVMRNNIVWQNRSFFFDASSGTTQLLPSNQWSDAVAAAGAKPQPLVAQTATGQCVNGAAYWDLGVVGDQSPVTPAANPHLRPVRSVLTSLVAGYNNATNTAGNPNLVSQYCNGSSVIPGVQFEPGTPFLPAFQLQPAATADESGNFVDLHFGPLSITDPANPVKVNGDYHIQNQPTNSSAFNTGTAAGAPNHDFDAQARPQAGAYDIGADELVIP